MTNEEMLEILRGKVLYESPAEIQQRLNEIADAIERLVRERDAALEDLKQYAYCPVCKHFKLKTSDEPCKSCKNNHGTVNKWEWRGVKDE